MPIKKKRPIPDTLPNSEEHEKAILSLIISQPVMRAKAVEKLVNEDFYHPITLQIFEQISLLFQEGKQFDTITFTQHLRDANIFDACAIVYAEICCFPAIESMFDSYISILKDKALLRQIIAASKQAIEKAHLEQSEIDTTLGDVQFSILGLKKFSHKEKPSLAKDIADKVERMQNGEPDTDIIKTWIRDLDEKSPLRKGDMPLITGRRKAGKSIFALSIMENICISQGKPGLYFSLEDRRAKVVDRIFAGVSRIPTHRHHVKKMTEEEIEKATKAVTKITPANLIIHDDAYDLHQIIAIFKQEFAQNPDLTIAAIDYCQLIRTPPKKGGSREQEVASVSRAFRLLSMETGVPILLLAQLNKDGVSRESAALEQDCTARWDIELMDEDDPMAKERMIRIPFQRSGQSGIQFKVFFDGEIARVENAINEHKLEIIKNR